MGDEHFGPSDRRIVLFRYDFVTISQFRQYRYHPSPFHPTTSRAITMGS